MSKRQAERVNAYAPPVRVIKNTERKKRERAGERGTAQARLSAKSGMITSTVCHIGLELMEEGSGGSQ